MVNLTIKILEQLAIKKHSSTKIFLNSSFAYSLLIYKNEAQKNKFINTNHL